MFEPTFIDKVEKRIQKQLNPILIPMRRNALTTEDFSIISQNCWGGGNL